MSQRHVLAFSNNLCISESHHFFGPLSPIWSWPVWLCCFRCECCYAFDSKQHLLHPKPPCLILIQKTPLLMQLNIFPRHLWFPFTHAWLDFPTPNSSWAENFDRLYGKFQPRFHKLSSSQADWNFYHVITNVSFSSPWKLCKYSAIITSTSVNNCYIVSIHWL